MVYMKKIVPIMIAASLVLGGNSIVHAEDITTTQENNTVNPYTIKIYDFTDKSKSLYFSSPNPDGNFEGVFVKINGKKYDDIFDYIRANEKYELYFGKTFPAGTKIDVYAAFLEHGTLDDKEVFVKTITVKDTTGPIIKLSDFSIRSTSVTISTEKGSTVNATYNGKKIPVKKISDTKWKATFKKPITNKKLVVTAKDSDGNVSKSSVQSVIPADTLITGNFIQVGNKTVSGIAINAKNTDTAYLKVGSKTYKSSIKNERFTIKIPSNIPSPKQVTFYLKDKFGNTLDSDKTNRTYKYIEPKVGMTKSQVLNTIQGAPDKKSSDVYGKDRYDYWMYDFYNYVEYVNFYNGKVMSISRYDN